MTYFTDNVRLLIEQDEVTKAMDKLLNVLQNGRKEIHDHAYNFVRKLARGNSKKINQASPLDQSLAPNKIINFLTQLEKKELPMVRFLSHIEIGQQKIDEGEWKEAKLNYELAKNIHQASFSLPKSKILEKINFCTKAINFNKYVDLGNSYFIERDWENAIMAYKKTLDQLEEEFGFDTNQINSVIATCSQGIRFNDLIEIANQFKSKNNWDKAIKYYNDSLQIYRDEFYPERYTIEQNIQDCQKNIKKDKTLLLRYLTKMNRKYITLFLILGIMTILSVAYYNWNQSSNLIVAAPLPQNSSSPEINSSNNNGITALSDEDNLTSEEMKKEGAYSDEKNQEDQLLTEEASLTDQPEIASKIPAPDEIKELITAKTNPEKGVDKPKTPLKISKTKSIEFEKGKIAIIPFCDGSKDAQFSKKVYMDASFAIRSANKSHLKVVSKNLIQGAIKDLGLQTNDFCSEENAVEVAKSLQAENIILGNIIILPDGQTRIICEILHVPTLKYSKEIILTHKDFQKLRNNLKKEIKQAFY